MDLNFAPEDEAFRKEVRDFIADAFDDELRAAMKKTRAGYMPKHLHVRWQKALHAKGWATPNWPVEYGGTGWSPTQKYIYDAEMSAAGAPMTIPFGPRMLAPVLMKFGSQEQKDFFLPKIQSTDIVFCQGYSEPGSGSDLASLKMKCEDKGDHWLLNGSKIWTSVAQYADWIFCLVRTSSEGKPQEGISFVLVPMDADGVTVDPIITVDLPEKGYQEVNQVFFEDVKIPKENMVGEPNKGWTYAKYLLEFERGGSAYSPGLHGALAKLKRIAGEEKDGEGRALIDDASFRRKVADIETQVTALEFFEKKTMSALTAGQNPGAASSVMKLRGSECLQATAELTVEAISYYAHPFEPETRTPFSNAIPVGPDHSVGVMAKHLNSRAATIYAGASEIQRNIMAKLVLGL